MRNLVLARPLVLVQNLVLVLALAALTLPAHADVTTRVDGSASASTTFEGSVTLTGFAADGDRLVANGTLSGTLEDAAGERLAEADGQPLRLAVDRGALRASCDLLTARLQAGEVQVGGQSVRLEPIELEIPARAGGAPLRETLCNLAEMLRGQAAAASLADSLDAALRTLG